MSQPTLPNGLTHKRERFAQLVAQGYSHTEAARQAFEWRNPKPSTIWETGSRLASHPKVKARIDELRSTAAAAAQATVTRTLAEAARIAYLDPADLIDPDTGGLRGLLDMPEDARRAIAEVVETYSKDGERTIRYKLHPKLGAIEQVARFIRAPGYERGDGQAPQVNVQVNVVRERIASMSDEEIRRLALGAPEDEGFASKPLVASIGHVAERSASSIHSLGGTL